MKGRKMTGFPTREAALRDFFAEWEYADTVEYVSIADSYGRIVAEDLQCRYDLPVHRSACADSIAVRSSDFVDGVPDTSAWRPGVEYVRADMGDDFPDCYDAAIMVEEVVFHEDGSIEIEPDVEVVPGSGVNPKGGMLRAGDSIIAKHLPIRATDLAALAFGGMTMVPVLKRPKVAFIPTGDELVPAGIAPARGQMIDSNSLMVSAMLREYGAEVTVFPLVGDEEGVLEMALDAALRTADLVVVNGGTAVGEADLNHRLLKGRGKLVHHYIAAAPGRPLALAVVDGKPVVNLPGPPAAAYYGTGWCLNACVSRMLHQPVACPPKVQVRTDEGIRAGHHMAFLQRMDVFPDKDGQLVAEERSFRDGSLATCMASNAQRILAIGSEEVLPGSMIEVELLRPLEYVR